ncbi:hypothetical protein ACLNAR_11445 [Priestia aryabhattai]|uniref:YunG family protein n=1 Tax=Priestia TaxID=2800373 RepID=UPI000BF8C8A3|nr:hypothetical protein [Priestia megaterium]PEU73487.1 hypothetical protein CN397_01605 [Priestia megaterium]UYP09899.1 hypothetical protein OIJ04_09930 [Priestia megaterium]
MNHLKKALHQSWSIHSSTKWTADNPSKGQCGVTALVVQDIKGGYILKTPCKEGWHFYNHLNGQRCDFTQEQFREPLHYADILSSREEAFMDTNKEQYEALKKNVMAYFIHKNSL